MAAAGGERWSLAGATALVTGGSKGIGHAIVEELAGFGACVHTCSRNAAELEECRRRWADKGLKVTVSVCDIGVRADREKLMDTVRDTFAGKLDILVNNAGQVIFKPAMETTAEEYSHLMATNLESCFHLSQLAHPLLRNATITGGGSIVHVSSIAGYFGFPALTLYCTTKGGMNQLTRSLAVEWAGDNIRVNCVAPGIITTDMTKDFTVKTRGFGTRVFADPIAAKRRAEGGGIRGVIPVHAGSLLCHWASHMCRWWQDHKRHPQRLMKMNNDCEKNYLMATLHWIMGVFKM
ncbi:unnamed protein product [Urochloa humidicola]